MPLAPMFSSLGDVLDCVLSFPQGVQEVGRAIKLNETIAIGSAHENYPPLIHKGDGVDRAEVQRLRVEHRVLQFHGRTAFAGHGDHAVGGFMCSMSIMKPQKGRH
jgi:hypothetical protein